MDTAENVYNYKQHTHTHHTHARKIMSARRPADRRKVQTQAKDAAVAAASSEWPGADKWAVVKLRQLNSVLSGAGQSTSRPPEPGL